MVVEFRWGVSTIVSDALAAPPECISLHDNCSMSPKLAAQRSLSDVVLMLAHHMLVS